MFNSLKKEIQREFIARPDESKDLVLYKWPDTNIRILTQITVQQDEVALFVKEGKVVGTIESGRHTLDGKSIPFLSMIIDAATGGNFFMSEIYFVSTRQFTNLPFGGMIDNVIDPTTNLAVGMRLFGEYAIKVTKPEDLILNLLGTKQLSTNEELTEWIKELLLKVFREKVSEHVAIKKEPILGIAASTSYFEKIVLDSVSKQLTEYGVEIPILGNVTISLKEEDEATLKQMTRDFAYAGNMNAADAALKLGMAQGLKDGSGAGNTAAGMAAAGMGIAMGMNAVNQTNKDQQPQPEQTPVPEKKD